MPESDELDYGEVQLSDHPSIQTQVAVIGRTLNLYMSADREWKRRMETKLDTALHLRGDVDRVMSWQELHDQHHGSDDTNIARRLLLDGGPIAAKLATIEALQLSKHTTLEADVASLKQASRDAITRQGVWLTQWKALTASAAAGGTLVGLILGIAKLADLF